jgi:hypothetical protein
MNVTPLRLGVDGKDRATSTPTVRPCRAPRRRADVNPEELDAYETDLELSLYREYRDVVRLYRYVVETERRFYLCNEVEVTPHEGRDLYFELRLKDAWVWDMYRPARFLRDVRVLTFRDVNVEELVHDEQDLPTFLEN